MAKAAHLSFSPFLIGFLLVLVVADIPYVRGEPCHVEVYAWGQCHECDDACRSVSPVLVSHTVCLPDGETGVNYCACCT
ncbi:hypothetical protein MKX01_036434 [Papaver californicum]|nr:hypothetical protein MKX01_036434 [Papaver californicum]